MMLLGGIVLSGAITACKDGGEPTPPATRTLSVQLSGSGGGTVTSQPTGINCRDDGGTCSAAFADGATVTLAATPGTGMTFTGWSGACTGTSSCVVTMDGNKSVGAGFTQPTPYTLEVELSGHGTGTVTSQPAGIECGPGSSVCSAEFDGGTQVTLAAAPTTGMTFAGWSGACTGTGACVVTLAAHATVTATFDNPNLVAVEIGPAGGQVVSADGRLTLTIPAGALTAPVTITVERGDPATLSAAFDGLGIANAYLLGPDGLEFQLPVAAEYRTDQAATDANGDLAAEVAVLLTEEDGAAVPLDEATTYVDGDAGTVRAAAELHHFSWIVEFRPRWRAVAAGVPAVAEGKTYPVSFSLAQVEVQGTDAWLQSGTVWDISNKFEASPGSVFDLDIEPTQRRSGELTLDYACTTVGSATFQAELRGLLQTDVPSILPTIRIELLRAVECAGVLPLLQESVVTVNLVQPLSFGYLGSDFAEWTFSVGGLTISGDNTFIVHDLLPPHDVTTRAHEGFRVSGTEAAAWWGPALEYAGGLFAYGPDGYGLYTANSPFGQTPTEMRTDIRVTEAQPAGGEGPTDAIVFTSPELGVGFVRYNADLGRFTVSDEVLPAGAFFGDRYWAYIDAADAPALVLANSQNWRLYYHARAGGAPVLLPVGSGSANGLRCLPPICLVFGTGVTAVFLFDGQAAPTRVADANAAIGFLPDGGGMRRMPSGNVAAAVVGGGAGLNRRVAEVEFGPDGGVVRVEEVTLPTGSPNGCSVPVDAVYVPDAAGVALIVLCRSTRNYAVRRSLLFDSP